MLNNATNFQHAYCVLGENENMASVWIVPRHVQSLSGSLPAPVLWHPSVVTDGVPTLHIRKLGLQELKEFAGVTWVVL